MVNNSVQLTVSTTHQGTRCLLGRELRVKSHVLLHPLPLLYIARPRRHRAVVLAFGTVGHQPLCNARMTQNIVIRRLKHHHPFVAYVWAWDTVTDIPCATKYHQHGLSPTHTTWMMKTASEFSESSSMKLGETKPTTRNRANQEG